MHLSPITHRLFLIVPDCFFFVLSSHTLIAFCKSISVRAKPTAGRAPLGSRLTPVRQGDALVVW